MSTPKYALVLAAGQSITKDSSIPSLILKNPANSKSLIENIVEKYEKKSYFVVGYQSMTILNDYPNINAIVNPNWQITRSAASLTLGLQAIPNDAIVDIYPSDCFLGSKFFNEFVEKNESYLIAAVKRENISKNSVILQIDASQERIKDSYKGNIKDPSDLEAIGIFRAPAKDLKNWCSSLGASVANIYSVETIPKEAFKQFKYVDVSNTCTEISSIYDFLNYSAKLNFDK